MLSPSGLSFQQESVNAAAPSSFQDFCVRNFVLSLDVKKPTETAQMKVVKLSGMSAEPGPGLAGVKEGSNDHCIVDLQLGGKVQSSPLPYIFMESPKGSAGFRNPVIDFGIYVHCTRECAAQIREVVDCLEVMPFHRHAWLLVLFSWGRLVHHFGLFGTDM